jgi:hypothetical protein
MAQRAMLADPQVRAGIQATKNIETAQRLLQEPSSSSAKQAGRLPPAGPEETSQYWLHQG